MSHLTLVAAEAGEKTGQALVKFSENPLVISTIITIVLIPLLNAAVTRPSAPDWLKNVITALLAGVFAVTAWLTNLGDVEIDWPAALVVFLTAVAGAGGVQAALVKGGIATKISNVIPINFGKPMTPERAAAMHSSKSGLTEPVPERVRTAGDLPRMDDSVLAAEQNPAMLADIKAQLDSTGTDG